MEVTFLYFPLHLVLNNCSAFRRDRRKEKPNFIGELSQARTGLGTEL